MDAMKVVGTRLLDETSAGTRVYPLYLPQNVTYPCISYFQISASQTHAMGMDLNLWRVRIQVDVWGETYAATQVLADEVRARLSRWKGTIDGVTVIDTLFDDEEMVPDPDMMTYRVLQEYTMLAGTA